MRAVEPEEAHSKRRVGAKDGQEDGENEDASGHPREVVALLDDLLLELSYLRLSLHWKVFAGRTVPTRTSGRGQLDRNFHSTS